MHPASRLAIVGCKGASHQPPTTLGARRGFWHDWLTHTYSLTSRIKSRSKHFEVRVLYEGMDDLTPAERLLLGAAGPWRAREVVLLADGHPVVWARTIVAAKALRGPWFFLRGLGSKPLGARLFSDPLIARSQFVFMQRYSLSKKGLARATKLVDWGPHPARIARLERRSVPALLTEVLLPALTHLSE